MDELLTQLREQLKIINDRLDRIDANTAKLAEPVQRFTADLAEFSERFEEVVGELEDERRLDLARDYEG